MPGVARLTIRYTLGATGENAANTIHLRYGGGFLVQSDADGLVPALDTWWTAIRSHLATGISIAGVRLDAYGDGTGRIAYGYDMVAPTGNASGGAAWCPTEVSTVVSLRSSSSGPAGRGRIFLPPPSVTQLQADGRLLDTPRNAYATATATMFTSWKALAAPLIPVIYSRTGLSTKDITSVQVGNVLDVQRGRRNRLVEGRRIQAVG